MKIKELIEELGENIVEFDVDEDGNEFNNYEGQELQNQLKALKIYLNSIGVLDLELPEYK